MSSYIEFGDFSVANIVSICDGVELPSSWSLEESFNSSLSFFISDDSEKKSLSFNELLLTLPSLQSMQNGADLFPEQANDSFSCEEPSTIMSMHEHQICNNNNLSMHHNTAPNESELLTIKSAHPSKVSDSLVIYRSGNVQPKLNGITEIDSSATAPPAAVEMQLGKKSAPALIHTACANDMTSNCEVPDLSNSATNDYKLVSSGQIIAVERSEKSTDCIGISKTVLKTNTDENSASKESTVFADSEAVPPKPQQSNLKGKNLPNNSNISLSKIDKIGENGHSDSYHNNERKAIVPQDDASDPTAKFANSNGASKAIFKREKSVTNTVIVEPKDDCQAEYFASELSAIVLVCKPKAFVPRGLYNSKNWCYINATLQALLACSPFFHMLKKLSFVYSKDRSRTSTPIMDSFVKLASQFRPLSIQFCHQYNKDIRPERPFTPTCVYEMLGLIKTSLSNMGGQEDAEEFLSCILNGFHEEILKLFALLPNEPHNNENDLHTYNDSDIDPSNGDISPSPVNSKQWTPISNIFRGKLCTTVTRPNKKPSVSFETFFTLPIDVSTECSWSVEDALFSLTDGEQCHDSDSDEDSDASLLRQQTIETLPPILILHLKRFFYDDKKGGLRKVDKKVRFSTDLIIEQKWLSESAQNYTLDQRSYKLFAVVYHHGIKATGGHYTADVFHIGLRSWLHFDDESVLPIKLHDVLAHSSKRTPYLLYYRQLHS